jgi:YqaJ-like viral recombinase domain
MNPLQRTDEWKARRVGKLTATGIADMLAKTAKGEWGAGRKNLAATIICERLTGEMAEGFQSREMERGVQMEAKARRAYAFLENVDLELICFVDHPTIAMAGCSPDAQVIGSNGGVEFKCPNTATHLETLAGKSIKGAYAKQVQWQIACTGWAWVDFVSYDDRLPEHRQYYKERVYRDDALIAEVEAEARVFLAEIEEKLASLAPAPALQVAA